MARPDIPIPGRVPAVIPVNGIPVRADTAYCNHQGLEKQLVRKFVSKSLLQLSDPLRKILEPGEVVLYVCRAQSPASKFEQLTGSWLLYHVTGSSLVLTNKRILAFSTKKSGVWRKGLRAVFWSDIAQAKVSAQLFSGKLQLAYRGGHIETYWGIRLGDVKVLTLLVTALLSATVRENTHTQTMASLCPECMNTLAPSTYQCPRCGLSFKDEKTLMYHVMIPGGGYFYVGQLVFGILDCVVEAWLALLLALSVNGLLFSGRMHTRHFLVLGVNTSLLLALEKMTTIRHCRRIVQNFIPTGERNQEHLMAPGIGAGSTR